MSSIGILGGGQLCLMLSEALHKLGARVHVYDPDPSSPARTRLANVTTREWTDIPALQDFVHRCDRVTYEMEHVPIAPLRGCSDTHRLFPSLSVLEATQDRIREKALLTAAGLPLVAYAAVEDQRDLTSTATRFGYPFVLKSALGGYDGKGQYLIRSPHDLENLIAGELATRPGATWVLEELVEIETEVSCIVARSASGQAITFPVLENLHRDHILDLTLLPARLSPAIDKAARQLAQTAAAALDLVGLLTVEFFVARSARSDKAATTLYINELAPRPHNSGHVTRNACTLSQFDALARVLTDVPLTTPEIIGAGAYCMGNLLGEVWQAQGDSIDLDLSVWERHPAVTEVYLYGKDQVRTRRKMGHFVAHAHNPIDALAAAQQFRRDLMIRESALARASFPRRRGLG